MTWDELRTLQSWGFEIGSHTRTHARLAQVSNADDLRDEIEGSKQDIEKNLGAECRYIAWPCGRKSDVNQAFLDAISRAGYRACFGGFRGTVVPGRTSRFSIPRHHLEAGWTWSQIRFFAYGHGEG